MLLQEEEWKKLNTQEKIDLLQTVAYIEVNRLELPNVLNVGVFVLQEGTQGRYLDETHMIYIDLEHIERDMASEVISTLLHEVYHSWQWRLVDAYKGKNIQDSKLYNKAATYVKEFTDYENGTEEIITYYIQQCEIDARKYARSAVTDYYLEVKKYIKNQEM